MEIDRGIRDLEIRERRDTQDVADLPEQLELRAIATFKHERAAASDSLPIRAEARDLCIAADDAGDFLPGHPTLQGGKGEVHGVDLQGSAASRADDVGGFTGDFAAAGLDAEIAK